MKKIYIFFLIISFMFVSCGKKESSKPSGRVVKVIVLASLDDKYERLGYQSLLGLKAAKKMKRYLSNGDEIVFDVIDANSKNIKNILKKSVLKDKPLAIISFMSSDRILSMQEWLKKYNLPIIVTLATNNEIVNKDALFVQVCIDNHKQSLVAAHYIRDEKFMKHVGVVYDETSIYSTSLANEFRELFKSLGGEIDFFINVSNKIGLEKFKHAKKANTEIIFNSTDSVLTTKMIKILKKENLHAEILGADGLYSSMLENSPKDAHLYDGIYVIDHFAHDIYQNKKREEFEELLETEGLRESSYALLAYDGYQLLVYAFQTCPNYNKECINAVLKDSETIQGISGNFSMIEAKARREVYVNKIKNTKLEREVVIY